VALRRLSVFPEKLFSNGYVFVRNIAINKGKK